MIFDSIQHMEAYKGIHPGVYEGLKLLRDTDFSKLEDARYEVDGDRLFFFIQTYQTKENLRAEAHRKYIDIQYVITGVEGMGVGALEELTEVEGRPEGDIWFYEGPMDEVTLSAGKFAVLWPGDGHAPGRNVGQPAACRKAVVKVRVE